MINSYAEPVATLGDRLTAAARRRGSDAVPWPMRLASRLETLEGGEVDQAEPTASLMGRIATVTGVSPVWLLTGQGAGPQDASAGAALRAELADLRRLLAEAAARVDRLEEALSHG